MATFQTIRGCEMKAGWYFGNTAVVALGLFEFERALFAFIARALGQKTGNKDQSPL